MFSTISALGKTVSIHVYSGDGCGPHVTLAGSTFPIVPSGTIVEKLSVEFRDGLQAITFFCKVKQNLSSSVLLSWEENDKRVVRSDENMSVTELAQFNSFVRSHNDVFVTDSNHKTIYTSGLSHKEATDPGWTYKTVSMDSILEYITRRITIKELDERATSEERSRNQLAALQQQNGDLLEEKAIADYNILALRTERDALVEEINGLKTQLRIADNEMARDSVKMTRLFDIARKLQDQRWPWVNARQLGKKILAVINEKPPKAQ